MDNFKLQVSFHFLLSRMLNVNNNNMPQRGLIQFFISAASSLCLLFNMYLEVEVFLFYIKPRHTTSLFSTLLLLALLLLSNFMLLFFHSFTILTQLYCNKVYTLKNLFYGTFASTILQLWDEHEKKIFLIVWIMSNLIMENEKFSSCNPLRFSIHNFIKHIASGMVCGMAKFCTE